MFLETKNAQMLKTGFRSVAGLAAIALFGQGGALADHHGSHQHHDDHNDSNISISSITQILSRRHLPRRWMQLW